MVEEPADSVSLSKKLDEMLSEAKLDVSLMERLRTGIENFGVAVNDINKTTSAAAATQQYGDQLALAANQDRKSTRLNSSHVAITYAVFCLNKKKDRRRRNITTHRTRLHSMEER